MYALQTGLEHKTENSFSDLKIHYHKYDRDYANNGFLDEYYSESIVIKGERNFEKNSLLSFTDMVVSINMIGEILKIEEVIMRLQEDI